MSEDGLGRRLHDRATRGEDLSEAERLQLDQWYSHLDEVESSTLASGAADGSLADLRAQVRQAIGRLATEARRMQELDAANEALREDNRSLRRRVSETVAVAA